MIFRELHHSFSALSAHVPVSKSMMGMGILFEAFLATAGMARNSRSKRPGDALIVGPFLKFFFLRLDLLLSKGNLLFVVGRDEKHHDGADQKRNDQKPPVYHVRPPFP
jgi:hypothetical protein